jgi:hypothetical protein
MNASSSSSGMRPAAAWNSSARQAAAIRSRSSREDAHHVDDERFALGAVEGLAPAVVHERQEVAGRLDRPRLSPGVGLRAAQPADDSLERGNRLGGPGEVAVGLLPGERDELLAVGGDDQRDAVRRREHRLDRRQPFGLRRQALAGPQRADLVHGPAHLLDRLVGVVRNAHLLEPQRETRPHPHDDATRRHLVQGGTAHRQHHGVPGEGVHRAERDAEAVVALVRPELRCDRRDVGDGIALEIGIVDPDGIEARPSRLPAPRDDLVDLAACRQAQPDAPRQSLHVRASPGFQSDRRGGARRPPKFATKA